MNTCVNCGNTFEGNFCNHCGQKLITKRFTLKESILWIFTSIFNLERGFLYTTRETIIRPGIVVNDFLKGSTICYAHPFRFLFIWATISAILGVYLNIYEESGLMINKMAGQTEEQLERSRKMLTYMKEYMSFVMIGMVPFMALGTYLIGKNKGLNYAEHLIMIAYGNASSIVIGLPVMFVFLFMKDASMLTSISMLLGILVMGRVMAQTLDDNLIVGILKYFVSFIIGIIVMMLFMFIFILIYAFIAYKLGLPNPFAK